MSPNSSHSDESSPIHQMLLHWAEHFYADEKDRARLVEQTIAFIAANPEHLSGTNFNDKLLEVMRKAVMESLPPSPDGPHHDVSDRPTEPNRPRQ